MAGRPVLSGSFGASRGTYASRGTGSDFSGPGVAVQAPVGELVVERNVVERLGAGILMRGRGRARTATVVGNLIRDVSTLRGRASGSVVIGIQVVAADNAAITENTLTSLFLQGIDPQVVRPDVAADPSAGCTGITCRW